MDPRLLNTQKNDVFEVMRANDIDPRQFHWKDGWSQIAHAQPISIIASKQRPEFFFEFDFGDTLYRPRCSPWEGVREWTFNYIPWPGCVLNVAQWALCVQAELNTPDPWQALPGIASTSAIALSADVLNTEFAHRETERIATALNQIKRLLLDHIGKPNKQAALVENEIQRLLNASEKMGRKDWTNLAIGSIVTLALQLALPPEVVKQAFEILKHALSGLVPLIPQVLAAGQHLT